MYSLDGKLGAYNIKALFPNVKQIFKNPKPFQLIQRLISFVLCDNDIFVDFFSGSATSAESVLNTIPARVKTIIFIQIQWQETVKAESDADRVVFSTIDQIGIERIIRAAKAIKDEHPDTTADLGFKHYTLTEPSDNTLDKLESFKQDENNGFVTNNTVLDDFGKPTVLATWLVRDGYGFTAPVEELDLAGYKGYYIGKHLYLIDPSLSPAAIEAIVVKYETDGGFNPENVVLFGYSFTWTETEQLQINLKRLKDTEKNLRINFDVRY